MVIIFDGKNAIIFNLTMKENLLGFISCLSSEKKNAVLQV